MNILFIHQNFPAQYVHAATCLAEAGHCVVSIGQGCSGQLPGVRRIAYTPDSEGLGASEFTREFELSTRNGLAAAREFETLKAEGFTPDLVIGHGGWGETLFVKDVWPESPLLNYCEFFYRSRDGDIDFDPEFPPDLDARKRVRLRNAVGLLTLESADRGQTPTRWQHSLCPEDLRGRIVVAHEGVDTELLRPDASARVWLPSGRTLGAEDEVVTFSARNLEPYRGFHTFMRALPEILAARPLAQVLIVGGDGVSYGQRPNDAPTWRAKMLAELGDTVDLARVRFLGRLPFRQYRTVLQVSSTHVYLTYPFVLSWSLVEALAVGALIVASDTGPVAEAITDGVNGRLTPFPDPAALAAVVIDTLARRAELKPLRDAARRTALQRYDLKRVCLPAHVALWGDLSGRRIIAAGARRAREATAVGRYG